MKTFLYGIALAVFVALTIVSFIDTPHVASKSFGENKLDSIVRIQLTKTLTIGEKTKDTGAIGTGFFFDDEGNVITNEHVVASSKDIVVIGRYDLTEYPATLIASSRSFDLAVIKINDWKTFKAHNKPNIVKWGNSASLQAGQEVWAAGNPHGTNFVLTQGIVSKPTVFNMMRPNSFYLISSAPLLPGNSGGPLFNSNGNVIGVNSMMDSTLSFSIQGNLAKRVVQDLIKNKAVNCNLLGFMMDFKDHHIYLTKVISAVGLEPGDVLESFTAKHFNIYNKSITSYYDLISAVISSHRGSVFKIKYLRNGKEGEASIPVISCPDKDTYTEVSSN